ncbi:hypothetical protein GCM10023340_27370 [Nocardioides marinquilinus]|uniref:Uncharacterized protein n=1 Tax=Nocardioides marinquilinus TaxID=1210400 RepID=A0ABP9PQC0_9ACTN
MAWEEELFGVLDELEQQAEALYDAERAPELADRSRAEYQTVPLVARLMASVDLEVALGVTGVGRVAGRLDRVAATWCVVGGAGRDWVVRLAAIAAVEGASPRAVPEVAWSPVTRLGVGSALRRLADEGERCVAHRLDGGRHDGVVRRVGQDFVELDQGDPPRPVLIALDALAAVRSE